MYNPNTTGYLWNAAQNNSAWFKFVADGATAKITISGITGNLQILAVSSSSSNCTASSNSVLSGGCPTDVINDTYLSPRYSNGSSNNNQLNLSGLTAGNTYYIIVDGTGGSISPFYLEISGASNGACSDILPVELIDISARFMKSNLCVNWSTLSEINNAHFDILLSENGINFYELARVEGNGYSNSTQYYSYCDGIN